ncbi:response regulator [Sphingobacterium sp.]|uniref:response regulator n=1 Tax=Sphingobacterium sp. TaxID=341027 RepID=UPI00289C0412|nr:response regulator [Sphingobacterium sp.]
MKKKIVICDDDVLILEVLNMALMSENNEIILTTDSKGLIALIDQVEPNLLLLDLQMPWMQGDDIVRELRSSERYNRLRIIMMSASTQGKLTAESCGADAFLSKPFELDDLFFLVRKMMTL